MKKTLLSISIMLCTVIGAIAQTGINYQAVVRDGSGVVETGTANLSFEILDGSNGPIWSGSESNVPITNGVVNAVIGENNNVGFNQINWNQTGLQLRIEVSGSFPTMTSTQDLQYVPYSLFSETAQNVINDAVDDADNSTTNELQNLSLNNGVLGISNGSGISLPWSEENSHLYPTTNTSDKKVSIGTTQEPSGNAKLWVNGFTRLGDQNAPAIMTRFIGGSGQTVNQQTTTFQLGVNASEIIGLSVHVDVGGQLIPPVSGNYTPSESTTAWANGITRNYNYQYYVSGSVLTITTEQPSSSLIGSEVKIFVTYISN